VKAEFVTSLNRNAGAWKVRFRPIFSETQTLRCSKTCKFRPVLRSHSDRATLCDGTRQGSQQIDADLIKLA
jgi:hypothetical protein